MISDLLNSPFLKIVLFFVILLFSSMLSWAVNSFIVHILKGRISKPTYKLISRIFTYPIFVLGLSFALTQVLRFELGTTLAALGILGALIILPLIPVLQSLAAGILLSFERPFKEEDIIDLGGSICIVKEINLRKTKLRSLGGEIFYVPNIKFVTEPIINYSQGEFIRVVKEISVSRKIDFEKIEGTILKICADNPKVLPNIPKKEVNILERIFPFYKRIFRSRTNLEKLQPRVHIKSIEKDSYNIEVWFWLWDYHKKDSVVSEVLLKVLDYIKKKKI